MARQASIPGEGRPSPGDSAARSCFDCTRALEDDFERKLCNALQVSGRRRVLRSRTCNFAE